MKKLNTKGFAHHVALVGFVVLFAIAGVAYMVASRANSCDSETVSGPMSGATCYPTSGPVTPPYKEGVFCSIWGITSHPANNEILKPSLSIYNMGIRAFTPSFTSTFTTYNSRGTISRESQTRTTSTLSTDKSQVVPLMTHHVKKVASVSHATHGTYHVASTRPAFSCTATVLFPTK